MRKIVISLLFGLVFSMALMAYADSTRKGIAESLVRLHVVANSDDVYDQQIKLIVRDALIDEFGPVLDGAANQKQAEQIITDNLKNIEKVAQTTLEKHGFKYSAKALYEKTHFPTKKYANIMLPPGEYDALRIVLGEGKGQNWWCVMYPPLCFEGSVLGVIDEAKANMLKQNIGESGYEIITQKDTVPVNFKFKILEIFDKVCK
ncbi:MAG: stage II sporulation protein R [Ruminococcaceae bacterium]|nr:stage II sporulation protein R [Oscillospiraceae bacterium]